MNTLNICDNLLKSGPNMGSKCSEPITSHSKYCNRCYAISDLIIYCQQYEKESKCLSVKDPYNSLSCNRDAIYKGYCLLCLSVDI